MKISHRQPRRRHGVLSVLLLAVLAGCSGGAVVAQGERTAPTATTAETPVLTSGYRLPPIVHRPEGVAGSSGPLPLLIVLQGSGGSPTAMQALTHFNRIANRHRFVVAYLATLDQRHPWRSPADLPYISATIDRLVASGGIDRSRVYVTGFSAGGKAVWESACYLSSKVAAVAVVEGGMPDSLYSGCTLSRPVSELLIIGDADRFFYPGIPGLLTTPYQSSAKWRALNGCPARPTHVAQVATVNEATWSSCTNGSSVGLDVVRGGAHTWPLVGASATPLFDASEAVWAFVSAHHLSPSTIGARLLSLRVTRVHKNRVVVASFRLTEPVTLQESLRYGHRRLANAKSRLSPRHGLGNASLSLARKTGPGRYTFSLTLNDAYGRALSLTRTIRVPKPPT